MVARGRIVITDNRITAIGRRGKVRIAAGAVVRNPSGKTIMPGLVDIHAHTWVASGGLGRVPSRLLGKFVSETWSD